MDVTTGLLKEVVLLENGYTVPIRQSFFCYESVHSRNRVPGQGTGGPSGAFVSNPAHDEPYDLGTHATYRVIKVSRLLCSILISFFSTEIVEELNRY